MNSYLGLVSEYTKAHKKKKRLTVICIAISVMLVTAIFGMADMSINAQINAYIRLYGNYHAVISGITDETAQRIGSRGDVAVADMVCTAEDTVYQGKELIVQGSGQELSRQMNLVILEGSYPTGEQEALLDEKALRQFKLSIGDTIELPFKAGATRSYRITGVYGEFSMLNAKDAHGLFLTEDGVRAIGSEDYSEHYYVQFKRGVNIRRAIAQIKAEHHLSGQQVSENIRLLGLMGQSSDNSIWQLYLTAAILFVLVTMAGVFMIAGSFNMSVMERTQFFGLLRCLGASKQQIKRYIRLEGLRYSVKGIPLGLLAGCLVMWGAVLILNALNLRFVLPEMPLFQISWPGVFAGALMGFLVVMLATGAPAKKASQVSPQAAVTGNMNHSGNQKISRAVAGGLHVDVSMGIHHASSNKKNLTLTAGSFALSIILLLSFTVFTVFIKYAVNPLKPYAPDISLAAADDRGTIERTLAEEVRGLSQVKQLYGRMFSYDIEANASGQAGSVTLVSYDSPQLDWADKMLIAGDTAGVRGGRGVLVGFDKAKKSRWSVGDVITLNLGGSSYAAEVSGILSDMPFDAKAAEWILVCSEKTFTELTGINSYTIIDMQVEQDISAQVRDMLPPEIRLFDWQQRNRESRTAYYTMAVFVYGFVFVIALVAFINIINTVNSGISSRMGYYGVMRAVGMSGNQMKRMVLAEAISYATVGGATGGILGLILHKFFFGMMITSNWGDSWEPPLPVLAAVILATLLTAFVATIAPARKILRKNIIDVVNAG